MKIYTIINVEGYNKKEERITFETEQQNLVETLKTLKEIMALYECEKGSLENELHKIKIGY